MPTADRSGCGDNLQALICYLTSVGKLSRRIVQKILADVFGVRIALGTLQNRLEDTSEALGPTCNEIEETIAEQSVTNIDENSYPHNGRFAWLWVFVTETFAFFTIKPKRSSRVLKKVLGEAFAGIICDRFSAYVKYHKDRASGLIQYCWAHIIRNIKGLPRVLGLDSPELFSHIILQRICKIFRLWYAYKRKQLSREELIAKVDIICPGCAVSPECPAANFQALTGAVKKWQQRNPPQRKRNA